MGTTEKATALQRDIAQQRFSPQELRVLHGVSARHIRRVRQQMRERAVLALLPEETLSIWDKLAELDHRIRQLEKEGVR